MAYFQNVFNVEFLGALLLSDRQYNIDFRIGANKNTSTNMVNWVDGPYNTTGNTKFAINISMNSGADYSTISVTLTSGSARTAQQIVDDLNSNATFAATFTASLTSNNRIRIMSGLTSPQFKAYIPNIADIATPSNTAESILKFNLMAPVVEMPDYFERHTIANLRTFSDSVGLLVKLSQPNEDFVITNAGLSTTPQANYALLAGKSGLFMFQKNTVDSSNRITVSIEYSAGAVAGDLARRTTYSYTGAKTTPDMWAQVPYTLTTGDIITPP